MDARACFLPGVSGGVGLETSRERLPSDDRDAMSDRSALDPDSVRRRDEVDFFFGGAFVDGDSLSGDVRTRRDRELADVCAGELGSCE